MQIVNPPVEDVYRQIKKQWEIQPIADRIVRPANLADRFQALREFYAEVDAEDYGGYPFDVDWVSVFTPIEMDLWGDLRATNLTVRPQYPVGKYFLDFAIPRFRIGIEADGRDWHDRERDAKRDAALWSMGWRIFRLQGHECFRVVEFDREEAFYAIHEERRKPDDLHDWQFATSSGLIAALNCLLTNRFPWYMTFDDACRVLDRHRLIDFPIIDDFELVDLLDQAQEDLT